MEKQYGISGTFFKRNGAVKSVVVASTDGVLGKKQSNGKIKAEGYRISEVIDINKEDPSDYKFGKEVTEFSVKYLKDSEGNVEDIIPAEADEEGAITVHAPFTTNEAFMFVFAYGSVNGSSKEIYNARTVSRSNSGAEDVLYLVAIGDPILKSLLVPELRQKITDNSGALLPEFREKFGKKKQTEKSNSKRSKVANILQSQIGL